MRARLEDVLRHGEVAKDLVLLLRGGVHREGMERLQEQAGDMNRRFSFEGDDCYGISVFAATEESEAWILARHMSVRRRYYRIRYADVAGLRVLPTFRAPHWSVMFTGPDGADYQKFMDALGDLRENPHWRQRSGRSPR
jgi:hypothetical protein